MLFNTSKTCSFGSLYWSFFSLLIPRNSDIGIIMSHHFLFAILWLSPGGLVMAQVQTSLPCRVQLRYLSPTYNQVIAAGHSLDVEVKDVASNTLALSAIKHIDLYLNNQFIGQDLSYPYRWDASRFAQLRNLSVGRHELKAKVEKKCGGWITFYQQFTVKNRDETQIGERLSICYRFDPMQELTWLKDFIRKNQKCKICEHRTPQCRFFKITFCQSNVVLWNDCGGKLICKNNCSTVQGAQLYKCWHLGCGD